MPSAFLCRLPRHSALERNTCSREAIAEQHIQQSSLNPPERKRSVKNFSVIWFSVLFILTLRPGVSTLMNMLLVLAFPQSQPEALPQLHGTFVRGMAFR